MFDKRPPVSLQQWLQRVNEDQSIPGKFKNGKENELSLTDTTFRSGSLINSTEFLHLRTIWHPYKRIESLGNMMKSDPETEWSGFVSAETTQKAESLFNEKRPKWKQYLKEIELRDSENKPDSYLPASSLLQRGAVPRQPMRPSEDCGLLTTALCDQTRATLTTIEDEQTIEELERAYIRPKSGGVDAAATIRFALNQPVSPITPRFNKRQTQFMMSSGPAQSTPEVPSYQPARGGKYNQPAADEEYVNMALLSFLQNLTMLVGNEFITLNWLGARLALRLSESVATTNPDTGDTRKEVQSLGIMEARVDGYLSRGESPFEKTLNKVPLALIEVKPFTLGSAVTAIRRQVGAEMASWISQAGDSTAGLLQSSTSGRKRRLMFTQYRHEIYVIVGEYGAGFEAYIRPLRFPSSGPAKKGSEAAAPPLSSSTERPIQDNSSDTLEPRQPGRPPDLLAGTPSFIRRMERMSIEVSGDSGAIRRNPQPTHHPTGIRMSTRTKKRWVPDPGDFLIMYEFGPFLTMDPRHMDLFIRRFIALTLEVRGPQDGFIPDTVSTEFLDKSGPGQDFIPNAASSSGATLKKARSCEANTKKRTWEG